MKTGLPPLPVVLLSLETEVPRDVWAYDGKIPGPTLRLRQGEPVRIVVENHLGQDTTVHWHGIRLPNAMDGVPGLDAGADRARRVVRLRVHAARRRNLLVPPARQQPGAIGPRPRRRTDRRRTEPMPVDRDVLWMLADWRIDEEGQIAPGFGNMMEAGMSGRVGNTVTLNGTVPADQLVRAGERIRLRLVNSSLARIMGLRFEGHDPLIIARDGQPCDPHGPEDDRLLLGPAMRVDLLIDMQGEPGRRYRVTDDFYEGLGYDLTRFVYSDESALRTEAADPIRLPKILCPSRTWQAPNAMN